MTIESIELSDAANVVIVGMCGYKCYSKHLPETPNQTITARAEIREAGLVGKDGLASQKAYTYVDNLLCY